jgi:hypothetical protein
MMDDNRFRALLAVALWAAGFVPLLLWITREPKR